MKLKNTLIAFKRGIQLEFSGYFRYKFGFFSDVIVFSVFMAFFLFADTGISLSERYNYDNYKALFLMGYIAWMFATSSISASVNNISNELSRGTFYRKLNSKCYLPMLLLSQLIAEIFIDAILLIVLLLLAYFIWNIVIPVSLLGILAIIISTAGMFGIGLIVGGLTLRFKRVGSITLLIQLFLLFVTDTLPTNGALLSITQIIPLTICNEIIRSSVTGVLIMKQVYVLIILSIVWLIVGNLIFNFAVNNAKKKGNLLFY